VSARTTRASRPVRVVGSASHPVAGERCCEAGPGWRCPWRARGRSSSWLNLKIFFTCAVPTPGAKQTLQRGRVKSSFPEGSRLQWRADPSCASPCWVRLPIRPARAQSWALATAESRVGTRLQSVAPRSSASWAACTGSSAVQLVGPVRADCCTCTHPIPPAACVAAACLALASAQAPKSDKPKPKAKPQASEVPNRKGGCRAEGGRPLLWASAPHLRMRRQTCAAGFDL
jgi:hypothetical protein